MRKVLAILIFVSVVLFLKVNTVKACQCLVWDCPPKNFHCGTEGYPKACEQTCGCLECVKPLTCGGGSYPCNKDGGSCCPMGITPTPGPNPSPGPGPNPPPSCTVTAATNLVATKTSPTSATLSWTPGAGGVYQAMWVSTNPEPQVGCAGSLGGTSVCPIRLDSGTVTLPSNTGAYSIDNLLIPGTVYYWKIMTVATDTCYVSSWALFPCDLSPSPLTISQGQTRTVYSTIPSSAGIRNVTFASSNTSTLTVNPASDITYIYQTLARAILQGSATITSNVYNVGGVLACTSTVPVTLLPPSPWWQVRDSDVQTAGDLIDGVPEAGIFNLDGPGGFPGVSAYGGVTYLASANTSSKGWLVNSLPVSQRTYDYAYFANQIPADITAVINSVDTADVPGSLISGNSTHDTNDYYWYKYDGDVNSNQALVIPVMDVGTRKVILMVDNADVNITGDINLTDGSGFFMLIVRGNINVDPTVVGGATPNLEGLYLADGTFNTGLGNSQLWVRGSLAGNLGINMQRNLGGSANSDPSEFFEYAPDQIMLYPKVLGVRKINWKEVAP